MPRRADNSVFFIYIIFQALYELELAGCNEITEAGLWACLNPRIVSLTLTDCINVADEAVGAVAQLLPALYEFSLQAYHVTDAALGYFSPKQSNSLNVLRLHSCWEITNHGVVNIGGWSKAIRDFIGLDVVAWKINIIVQTSGVSQKMEEVQKKACAFLSYLSLEFFICTYIVLQICGYIWLFLQIWKTQGILHADPVYVCIVFKNIFIEVLKKCDESWTSFMNILQFSKTFCIVNNMTILWC